MANPSLIHLSQILNGIKLETNVDNLLEKVNQLQELTTGLDVSGISEAIQTINDKPFKDYIKLSGTLNIDGSIEYDSELSDVIYEIDEVLYDVYDESNHYVLTSTGERAKVSPNEISKLANNAIPGQVDPNSEDEEEVSYIPATKPIRIKLFIYGEIKFSDLAEDFLIDNSERDLILASIASNIALEEDRELLEDKINDIVNESITNIDQDIQEINNSITSLQQQVNNVHKYIEF